MTNNSDMPISPVRGANNVPFRNGDYGAVMNSMIGLTKREHFAAMAMQAAISNPHECWIDCSHEGMAKQSVQAADALLKELEK